MLQGTTPKGLKRKMLLALEQYYTKMSTLGAASRLVEALFTWAGIPEKEVIAQSLVRGFADVQVPECWTLNCDATIVHTSMNPIIISRWVQGSKYGAPLCETCMLELYRRSPESWRRRITSSEKQQAQYEKLFSDSASSKSKAKRKAQKKAAAAQSPSPHCGVEPSDRLHPDVRQRVEDKYTKRSDESGAGEVSKPVMEQLGIGMPEYALSNEQAGSQIDRSGMEERILSRNESRSTKRRKTQKFR